jgi:hypothetical protein
MNRDNLTVPRERHEEIVRQIASDDSPVGIDAKKTHVIIIDLLLDLNARLARLEERLTDRH